MKKKRRPTSHHRAEDLIDPFDQAVDCGRNLATFAELMQKCSPAEWVKGQTVSQMGVVLLEEVRKQQAHLQALKP